MFRLTLKTEALLSPETSGTINPTTRRHKSEGWVLSWHSAKTCSFATNAKYMYWAQGIVHQMQNVCTEHRELCIKCKIYVLSTGNCATNAKYMYWAQGIVQQMQNVCTEHRELCNKCWMYVLSTGNCATNAECMYWAQGIVQQMQNVCTEHRELWRLPIKTYGEVEVTINALLNSELDRSRCSSFGPVPRMRKSRHRAAPSAKGR
jgi:hypothetical protein